MLPRGEAGSVCCWARGRGAVCGVGRCPFLLSEDWPTAGSSTRVVETCWSAADVALCVPGDCGPSRHAVVLLLCLSAVRWLVSGPSVRRDTLPVRPRPEQMRRSESPHTQRRACVHRDMYPNSPKFARQCHEGSVQPSCAPLRDSENPQASEGCSVSLFRGLCRTLCLDRESRL